MSHSTTRSKSDVGVLGFGDDNFGELGLDLLSLIRVKLEPEVSTVLRDAFPELDGRELADLHSRTLASR